MRTFSTNRMFLSSLLITIAVLFNSPYVLSDDKAPWVGETLDGKKCKGNRIGFGPHDYLRRAQLPAELEVVEVNHFTPEVERLDSGITGTPIDDIAYTIMAWPNHHRALHSAVRYRMMFWEWPADSEAPPAECQLQRAIAFSPQDPVPYMMYGLLLHKAKQYDKALLPYRAALRLRPEDILTQYNMGLTLVELQQYEEAVKMAKSAYTAGMPLPGLKNKLIAAGKWQANSDADAPGQAAQQVKLTTEKKPTEDEPTKGQPAEKQPDKNQTGKQQTPEQPAKTQPAENQPAKDKTAEEDAQKAEP